MTYNCGTPLIHILHAWNGYIKSELLRQSFEFLHPWIEQPWESYSRIRKSFDSKIKIDIMLRNQYTLKSIFMIE